MLIEIHTDHTIAGHETLVEHVRIAVDHALSRMSQHISRVDVHLSDENGAKGSPNDKRCVMEARVQGRPPLAVTRDAASIDQAVHGAAEKLIHLIESTLGRAARPVAGQPD